MQLRDYQIHAVNSIYEYFASGNTGNPIVVLPTASGKSLVIAELIRSAMASDPNQRFIVATHTKELIAQNCQKLRAIWHNAPCGFYSAGLGKKEPHKAVVFGGIQSMYKKAHVFGFRHLLIVDECQLLSDEAEGMYQKYITGLKQINPQLKVIGFSATPFRMKGGHLIHGKTFTDVCFELPIKKLLDDGYLCPVYTRSPEIQADLSEVKTIAGEYNQRQMQAAFMQEGLTAAALDDVFSRAQDRKCALFFCAGVEHAEETHLLLKQRGLRGAVVSADTKADERDESIARLRDGRYDYLCNNAVLTTGTDIPRVDLVVLLRSTKSRGLYIQIVGRGMRLYEGKKHCLLLDYGGNVQRFGAIDVQPTSKQIAERDPDAETRAPFKISENHDCR